MREHAVVIHRYGHAAFASALFALACGGGETDGATSSTHACEAQVDCSGCATCTELCECRGASGPMCRSECGIEDTGGREPSTGGSGPHEPDEPDQPDEPPVEFEDPLVETLPDGTHRMTITSSDFELEPGEEAFYCQGFRNAFDSDVAVIHTESIMTLGSHHLLVLQGEHSPSALERCDGLQFGTFIHSSQRSNQVFAYPDGVGRMLPARDNLRLQMHYFNTTDEPIHATVRVTITATEPDQVDQLASSLFINTLDIDVPPMASGSATKSCTIPHDIQILTAGSHMHRHGIHFEASTGGAVFHSTDEWAEPEVSTYDPPFTVPGGSEIRIECQYENQTEFPLTFGESADTNEMCILNSVFFPAPAGEPITCLL